MLQNPRADDDIVFHMQWIRYYVHEPHRSKMNIYILVDPASEKKKTSDFTCMWVIGLHEDGNMYILDCVYDKLRLSERAEKLIDLVLKWHPNDIAYERYGMMGDIEHIQYVMEQESHFFKITEVGGKMPKPDRIKRMQADFENGRVLIPREMLRYDYRQMKINVIDMFLTEYENYPASKHDDMLDALSRIKDIRANHPQVDGDYNEDPFENMRYDANDITGY